MSDATRAPDLSADPSAAVNAADTGDAVGAPATQDTAGAETATTAEGAEPGPAFPDIAALRYEDAREELVAIVARLEAGQAPLEDSMHLWRRGEALAAHCATWLDGAQAEIEAATDVSAN